MNANSTSIPINRKSLALKMVRSLSEGGLTDFWIFDNGLTMSILRNSLALMPLQLMIAEICDAVHRAVGIGFSCV